MQTVSIKGQQHNCEAAKRKIKELTGLSMEREHHYHIEVCAWNEHAYFYCFSVFSWYMCFCILAVV